MTIGVPVVFAEQEAENVELTVRGGYSHVWLEVNGFAIRPGDAS